VTVQELLRGERHQPSTCVPGLG